MLKKDINKYLSVVLSVLMLLAILPVNVIAVEENNRENTFLRSLDCDYCGKGQIVSKTRTDKYVLEIEPCGHSAKCDVEKTKVVTQSWTQCTTRGCYHSDVKIDEKIKYIHTSCGR
ncbi:hypothetical protein [Tissierella praeacuta]|uniref:hypothetical protein n=1 Tax=Tissierella praeacuta TaxID=43131 RepID=UPI00289DEE19|nr:hypothetical protein [Tissierella praeacuta]